MSVYIEEELIALCEYRWKKELKKIILYYMLSRGNDL